MKHRVAEKTQVKCIGHASPVANLYKQVSWSVQGEATRPLLASLLKPQAEAQVLLCDV